MPGPSGRPGPTAADTATFPSTATSAGARHRKPPRRSTPVAYALQHKRIAAALAGSTLLVAAATPVALHWRASAAHPTALDQTQALGAPAAAADGAAPQGGADQVTASGASELQRSEEHTSELQSPC